MSVRFVFANGYISAIGSGGLSAVATTHTPASTAGVPVCDPTLTVPTVMPLLVDVDPVTRQPTASTEIVYVTDTRTVPWTLQRATESMIGGVAAGSPILHSAGAVIGDALTAAVMARLAAQSLSDLSDLSIVAPVPGEYIGRHPTLGIWHNRPIQSIGELDRVSNTGGGLASATATASVLGPVRTPTTNTLLQVEAFENQGKPVYLLAGGLFITGATNAPNIAAYVKLALIEQTLTADLTAAGLTAFNLEGIGNPPAAINAIFQVAILPGAARLASDQFPIPRSWQLQWQFMSSVVGASAGPYSTSQLIYIAEAH